MSNIKNKIFSNFGTLIQKTLYTRPKKVDINDKRKEHDFKLVYFCGKTGIDYLNASLFSVYKTWDKLPRVIILTDGTDTELFKNKMIRWPKEIEIIPWEIPAEHYKKKGNIHLYEYASKQILGRKFTGVLYCAEKGKILYSDTDVLWYNDPEKSLLEEKKPYLKMSEEATVSSYSLEMLSALKEEHIINNRPLNSGVVLAHGEFYTFPKWNDLSLHLSTCTNYFSDQTAFAVLTNYFGDSFSQKEIMLQTDDKHEILLKKYKSSYKEIYARHYVDTRPWLFWRDYLTKF